MGKGAEGSSGTAARLLHVVALGGLVDLWVELLLRAGVAILAAVSVLTLAGVSPFIPVFDVWTWRRPGPTRVGVRWRQGQVRPGSGGATRIPAQGPSLSPHLTGAGTEQRKSSCRVRALPGREARLSLWPSLAAAPNRPLFLLPSARPSHQAPRQPTESHATATATIFTLWPGLLHTCPVGSELKRPETLTRSSFMQNSAIFTISSP